MSLRIKHAMVLLLGGAALASCQGQRDDQALAAILEREDPALAAKLRFEGESRLANIKQLTFGGENAEAYFSKDATELIFQSTRDGLGCDQIFRMDVDGRNQRLVSTGQGRTTCGYIFPSSPRIIYSSTHATRKQCPERPDYSKGYVWRLQPELDMYIAGPDGQAPQPFLPHPGYDAEAVVSPVGDRVLFTSTRDGDVDIYSANADGSDLKRLTEEVGYDGGAFFSPDGAKIIYRAHHPKTPEALKTYKELLAQDLVRPSVMELFVMDADGSNKRQITSNGAANFAPYFHPSGDRVIFSSNMDDPKGRDFDLYMIGLDGQGLERITFNPSFDSFPMFSADGRRVVFASNRNAKREGETNVFIADWVAALPSPQAARLRGPAEIEATTWSSRAARLSDPKLMGRGLGTPELDQAAKLIATQYEMIGLLPAGDKDQGDYMQRFEVPTETTVKAASLKVGELEGQLDADFRPAPFSANATIDGELAFVGYGIRAPSLGYDDYEGIDVKDKIVVVLRHEPGALDPESKFDGIKPTRHSDLSVKAIIARQRGAKGMLIINDAAHYQVKDGASKHPDELLSMQVQGAHTDVGLPVMHLSWAGAARLLPSLELAKRQQTLDQTQRPASALLKAPRVSLSVELARLKSPAANVIGRLAAREDGAPTERALIIGAHYDHLGMGGAASMRPEAKAAHPGADDNASGVATILELAEALKATKRAHDVYVVAFTGEEAGLLGSTHLAQHLPLPKERVLAMMNFDMVGRLKDGQLTVMGVDTAVELRAWARQALAQVGLSAQLEGSGYGPSDHMAFTLQQIPVLHFFTGLHADYHTPDDTADKLDAPGAVKITQLAYTLAMMILESPTPPQLVTDTRASSPHGGDSGHSGARAYGPYFGSIPSFGQDPSLKGALIGGVQPGSPAEAAGLKKGDVIVKFGPDEILSMQEYAMSLRKYKPGDEVEVVVMREGQQVKLKATLGKKDK